VSKNTDSYDVNNFNKSKPILMTFGARNRHFNLLLLTFTILRYVTKQRTSLGFPLTP